ncbi:hypothetical protein E4U53_004358 [Claviceps sorghi]|nr:hypothetical protein E4U53_004358 [Claviceps sorghi]
MKFSIVLGSVVLGSLTSASPLQSVESCCIRISFKDGTSQSTSPRWTPDGYTNPPVIYKNGDCTLLAAQSNVAPSIEGCGKWSVAYASDKCGRITGTKVLHPGECKRGE